MNSSAADSAMSGNIWLLIAITVLAIVAVLWFIRSRYGSSSKPNVRETPTAVETPPVVLGGGSSPADIPPPVAETPEPEPELAPVPVAEPAGPPDDLSKMKGVGPKLIALLGTLGVTRYDQIAAWSEADIVAIDARLGAFKGRPTKDKWVEQAAFLAKGDIAGFEATFGKI